MFVPKELSALISGVLARGFQIDPDAFVLLSNLPLDIDVEAVLEKVIEGKLNVVSNRTIRRIDIEIVLPAETVEVETNSASMKSDSRLEIMSDPTDEISPEEAESGFKKLFEDRYAQLMSIARRRPDSKNMISASSANRLKPNEKAKIAGLLSSRISKKGNVELIIDDPTGTCRILCSDKRVVESASRIPLDALVMIELSRSKGGQFYANSVSLPDIPSGRPVGSSHRAYAILLSDLHIGSRMFLQEDFERFVQWLNGTYGDDDLVSRVRYLVIAGDVVDGVGVYPGQEYQLSEVDLKRQYLLAAQLISGVPKRIQIIISPGNHDPVRQALPQPAIPSDFGEPLYVLDNVKMVGNPVFVKLNGVTFLVYHGRSLDDIIGTIPELSYDRPATAMQILLKARHLAPIYGKRTALSPEKRDMLVIDPVPDVFHSGHVHTIDTLEYRGTSIINSGTWQSQTHFQANMGLDPTPSIFPIVNLSTLDVTKRSMRNQNFVSGS